MRPKTELFIQIVSSAFMRRLNRTYRGKDQPTDVLTFPLWTKRELSTQASKHGILDLGDIFINRADARKRFLSLATHGFLHLLGFDHERSKREEKIMFALQDEIIAIMRN